MRIHEKFGILKNLFKSIFKKKLFLLLFVIPKLNGKIGTNTYIIPSLVTDCFLEPTVVLPLLDRSRSGGFFLIQIRVLTMIFSES